MAIAKLIEESRNVSNTLNSYYNGEQSLSLKEFDRLLRHAQHLMQKIDKAIGETVHSQSELLQMREKLKNVVADNSFEMDKIDSAIDKTIHSQNALLQMHEKLENAVTDDYFGRDNDDNRYGVSGNPFGVFGGLELSVRKSVCDNDDDFTPPAAPAA